MADYHTKVTGPDLDLHFRMAMDVLEKVEHLEARGEPVTPDSLYQHLQLPLNGDPTITVSRIEQGLSQVQYWREQFITRDIVHHRLHLAILAHQVQGEIWRLQQYQYYFDDLLRQADTLLKNTLNLPTESSTGTVGARRQQRSKHRSSNDGCLK
jgi:hypothetical protein